MRLYLVHGSIKSSSETRQVAKWVGSQAEVALARKTFREEGAKHAELETKEMDVPTDKAGLLAFLNKGEFK